MQVLIIDSSIQIVERLEEVISGADNIMLIHKAVFYEEAKKLFIENKYDVVVLDIDLPGSLELVKEIKKTDRETCVIILFTHTDNNIQEQYRHLGINLFVDKYHGFEQIFELVAQRIMIHKYN